MSAASLSPSSCLDDLLYLLGDQDGWAVQKAKFMSLLAALSWTDEAAENMWAEWVGFCGVEVEEGKKAAHVTSLSRAQLVEMYSLSEYEREGDEFALLMLVREMFKAFDVRGQGVFTAQDMADAFERGNLDFVPGGTKDMDAEFAAAVFAAVDLDGNGELDFDEFAAAVLKWDTSAFMQMKGISTPDSEVKNKTNQEKTYIAHNLDQSSLEHSLDRVMKCWEDPDELLRFSRHWLGNLFKSHPETIPLFNANLNANVKPVFLLLQQIVYSLESFEEWIPRLQRLGVKHIEMGVTQEHFHSLLTSFFKAMPVDISQEEKKQWTTLFDLIYYTMMTASERKDLLNDPNLAVGRMVEYGQDQPYLNPEVTTGEAFADYVLRAGLHHPASTHEYLKRFGRGTSFMHPRRACLDFVTEYRKYSRSFLELSKKITSQMACPELRDMVESDQKEEEGLVDPEASLKLQAKGYSVASFDGIPHTELFENLVKLVTERATGGDDTKKEGGERGGGQEEGPGDVFTKTMTEIAESSPHQALGAFAYGAELLVPVIYPLIYSGLKQVFGDEQAFVFFPLHTICDDEHGTTLLNVVVKLTGNDKEAREAVFRGAKLALRARSVMWDGLLARANKMPVDPESNSPSAVSPPLPRPPVGGGCPFAITEALGEAKAEAEKGKSSAPCAAMGKGGGDGSGCPLAPAVSVKEGKGIGGVDEKDGAGGGGAQGLFSEATAGKSVSELYDEQSNAWARREPSCLSDFTGRPALFNMCKPFIQGASVLDVGCGEGYCARILSEMGAKDIIGIDISSDMIEKAKAAEEASPLGNIKYVAGDSRSLVQTLQREAGLLGRQFQTIEESFDVIVAVFLFNYMTIEDMKQVGHDVQRLLKDGGHFIFSVPHPCSPWWQREHVPPFHWKRPTEQQNYFNAMDQCLEGKIYRTDGGSLNVRNFHKRVEDYFNFLQEVGFTTAPMVKELTVDSTLAASSDFFAPLEGVPLHMCIGARKTVALEQAGTDGALGTDTTDEEIDRILCSRGADGRILPALASSVKFMLPPQEVIWNEMLRDSEFVLHLPQGVLDELYGSARALLAKGIDHETYTPGDVWPLAETRRFGYFVAKQLMVKSGNILIRGLDIDSMHETDELHREKFAKLCFFILASSVAKINDTRGRLFDVRNRGLDASKDNVLFSAVNSECGWHTDGSSRDWMPDCVGLLCVRPASQGGEFQMASACNAWHRLQNRLPAFLLYELRRPLVRDILERGVEGFGSGSRVNPKDFFLLLSRSPAVLRQRIRLNSYPIFDYRDSSRQMSFRFIQEWLESGHRKAGYKLSPLTQIATIELEKALWEECRFNQAFKRGDIGIANNHIVAHRRNAFMDEPGTDGRLKVRVWLSLT